MIVNLEKYKRCSKMVASQKSEKKHGKKAHVSRLHSEEQHKYYTQQHLRTSPAREEHQSPMPVTAKLVWSLLKCFPE